MMNPFSVCVGFLSLAVAFTSYHVNRLVPEPYLDEVFHIPQAQAYCRDAFTTWDPKLTTPAGLYLLAYPLSYLNACTPPFLRAVNGFGVAILLPAIVYRIQQTLHGRGRVQDPASAQTAVNVALFPLLYFFGGLFYTDVWSTACVLAAYLACLLGRPWVSGVYCWVALWFRQTNVVWVVFMAGVWGVSVLQELQLEEQQEKEKQKKKPELGMFLDPRRWREISICNPTITSETTFLDLALTPLTLIPSALRHLVPLLVALTPYTLVLLSFLLFLATNSFTIVLGDKTAHTASLHLPQLLYFTAATAFFSFPLYLPQLPSVRRPSTLYIALVTVAAAAAVHYNTVLHPYLLADNRHYAFYVFRRILLRVPPWSLLLPVPAYVVALWLQARSLDVTVAWGILYVFATAATLVGAGLVEPRYFIIAWVLWRVHVRERRRAWLWVETAWFLGVNAVTVWVFLFKSFEWESEIGARQRFMW